MDPVLILVLEDETLIREMVKDALEERGFTMAEASSPQLLNAGGPTPAAGGN